MLPIIIIFIVGAIVVASAGIYAKKKKSSVYKPYKELYEKPDSEIGEEKPKKKTRFKKRAKPATGLTEAEKKEDEKFVEIPAMESEEITPSTTSIMDEAPAEEEKITQPILEEIPKKERKHKKEVLPKEGLIEVETEEREKLVEIPADESEEITPMSTSLMEETTVDEEKIAQPILEEIKCIVHKGPITEDLYVCPSCQAIYCEKCAEVLKKKEGKCLSCKGEIKL